VTATADWSERVIDHYHTLGVPPLAAAASIEAAYRRQVRRWHPDANRDPRAAERMVALNHAKEILSDPVRRAAYDRRRLAALPPQPRLEPIAVDFGIMGAGSHVATATVGLFNDGGRVATVRVEPESGPFWALSAVRGGNRPDEVASLDLQPRVGPGAARGPQRSVLRVIVDDQPLEVALTAWIDGDVEADERHRPWQSRSPVAVRRRGRPAVAMLAAALVAGVLALWPGGPGRPVLARLVDRAGVSVPTNPAAGPGRSGPANPAGPRGPRHRPEPMGAQAPPGPAGGAGQPDPTTGAVSTVEGPHGMGGPGTSTGR